MKSNKTLLTLGAIIVVIVILFGGYKVIHKYSASQMNSALTTSNQSQPLGQAQSGSLPNKGANNSDIDADIQSIQGSMTKLQQDQNTASQDKSSQDTPQQ